MTCPATIPCGGPGQIGQLLSDEPLGCGMAIFLFLPENSRRCDWLITKEG